MGTTLNIVSGKVYAKTLVAGVPTLQTMTVPATSITLPTDGTFSLSWNFQNFSNVLLATPGFCLYKGNSTTLFNNPIPLYLITRLGGVITHFIDRRLSGTVGSQGVQDGAITTTHLDPSVLAQINNAGKLATLTDVTLSSPANHDVLSYNASTSKWINTVAASGGGTGTGATALSGLSDVAITSPSNGQQFVYNGSVWVNLTPLVPSITYAQLPTSITGTINANGSVDSSKLTGTIPASSYNAGSTTLAGLTDVSVSGVSSQQYLNFNGIHWVASYLPTQTLQQLTDVQYQGQPSEGQALIYNNTTFKWENRTLTTGGSTTLASDTDVSFSTLYEGAILRFNGTTNLWNNHFPLLEDNQNVYNSGASDRDYLTFSTANNRWENKAFSESIFNLLDVNYTGANVDKNVLAFNTSSGYWEQITPQVTKVTGILPVANGGTNSTTQNWVGLTGTQSVAGAKTFSSALVASSTLGVTGALTGAANVSGKTIQSKANGSTLAYCIPVYTAAGAITAATLHAVQGQIAAAAGTSTTITFTGTSIFANTQYSISIADAASGANAAVTAIAVGSIVFTSVSGHNYNFLFIGV